MFRERVYSVLLVSAAEKFNSSLSSLLPETDFWPVRIVKNAGAARRELLERSYDLVLINTPLPDDFGTKLAIDAAEENSNETLLFVKNDLYNEIYDKVIDFGVLVLPKPLSGQMVSQSLRLMCASRERLRRMEKKAASIEEKMEEIRLVNRAKWLLIDKRGMTEEEAHRYIVKQAMDRCITRRELAEKLIQTEQI